MKNTINITNTIKNLRNSRRWNFSYYRLYEKLAKSALQDGRVNDWEKYTHIADKYRTKYRVIKDIIEDINFERLFQN